MPIHNIIPPELLSKIVKDLRDSYSPFELDKSVYSLALTCTIFYRVCEPLLYSRYSNEDQHIGKLSQYIRMLIWRPDRWPDVKFVSIEWSPRTYGGSLSIDEHIEMLEDVPFLATAINRLPDMLCRPLNQTKDKFGEVEKREPCTTYVTDLEEAFERLLDVGVVQTYAELLIYIFTILNPYIERLQIKMKTAEGYDVGRGWRPQIFTKETPLKFISLEELHYDTAAVHISRLRDGISITLLSAGELDLFMRVPTLRKMKVDGFVFRTDMPSRWVREPGSCAVESLDLTYNFRFHFAEWKVFLSVFKELKHFSYCGFARYMYLNGSRYSSFVPQFLKKLMQGIFVHRNSLESLSLMRINRSISDYAYLRILTTPGFTQFSCLKHMKMQLELLIGLEDESFGFRLHELLPKSLETLELLSQASLECKTFTENLLALKEHKKISSGFALQEVKLVYEIEKFQVEETWKIDMIKDLGENGIHLVFLGLPSEHPPWAHKLTNRVSAPCQ
ncbi:hypothetical protein EAE96_008769 [Botrytis aclada]|nr:hypothetical protein EAE96_008769 [Botrytis aclada]